MEIIKQYIKDGRIVRELKDNKKIISPTQEEISAKSLTSSCHLKESRICIYCGSTFNYGKESWASTCGLCKIEYKCAGCGEIKIGNISKMHEKPKKKLLTGENFTQCCSHKCQLKQNHNTRQLPGICEICGEDTCGEPRSMWGLCEKCRKLHLDKFNSDKQLPGTCSHCGKDTGGEKRDPFGRCIKCLNKDLADRQLPGTCSHCGEDTGQEPRDVIGRCKKCEDKHHADKQLPGTCSHCGKDTGSKTRDAVGRCDKCKDKYFADKQLPGKCFNCGEDTGKELRDNLGRCTKCHNLYFDKINGPSFTLDNKCVKHPEEKERYGDECWSCYCERIYEKRITYSKFAKEITEKYNGSAHSTGRVQGSQAWKGRIAFERYLKDQEIGWFVYIKSSFDKEGNIRPHSVCKTSSHLINEHHSDIGFSMSKNSAAVKFLKKENLKWDMTQIMVIPCKSEEEAFRIEKKIQKEYGLLG